MGGLWNPLLDVNCSHLGGCLWLEGRMEQAVTHLPTLGLLHLMQSIWTLLAKVEDGASTLWFSPQTSVFLCWNQNFPVAVDPWRWNMFICPSRLSSPSISEIVATVALDFVFLEKSILDRLVLAREVISRPAVEFKECFLILHSLAMVQGFVPSSEASCPIILGIILLFFSPTLNSAEMRFRQHLDLIT